MKYFTLLNLFILIGKFAHSTSSVVSITSCDLDALFNKKLEDLNIDVKLTILEEMDIHALLSFAETCHHFSFLAADVFRRKYSRKLFQFENPLPTGNSAIIVSRNRVDMRNAGTISRVLEHFGHFIPKISILYNQYDSHGVSGITNIIQLINSQCSDTLLEFDINMNPFLTFEFFEHMTKPFENLKKLSISGQFMNLASSKFTFSELFPVVENLSFMHIQMADKMCLEQHFPYLNHLYVEISQAVHDKSKFTEIDVEKLFKNNRQIRSLKLGRSSLAFLKKVSESLPDLEHLSLISLYHGLSRNDDVEIIFKNMKQFSIEDNMSHIPGNIKFANLVEFDMVGSPLSRGEWIDFMMKNQNLKKLTVKRGYTSNNELRQLVDMNLNITEISLMLNQNVDDDTIIDFVRKHKNMTKIHFKRDFSLKHVTKVLRKDRNIQRRVIDLANEILIEC